MRGHEEGVSLVELLAAVFLISIAIIPILALYPDTLGISRETEYDTILGAAAARKMEENITILRVPPVVFDASAQAGVAAVATSSATITIGGSANFFVILIGIQGTTAVSSVTVGTAGATLLLARDHATLSHRSELWTLPNPPTGGQPVTVTMAAGVKHAWVATTFRNVLSATPLGGSAGNDGNSLTPSVTISPRTTSSMMVGGFLFAGIGLTITQVGAQDAIGTVQTTGGGARSTTHLAQEDNQDDTGTVMDWTISGVAANKWVALAAELRGTVPVGAATVGNGTATCTDLPNCLLVWTTAIDSTVAASTVRAVGTLQTLNVVACQDTNGNSACDAGERQVRYDAKITSHP